MTENNEESKKNDISVDRFELSLRILGNEMIGVKLESESRWKNWAFFGVMILIALTVLFEISAPVIVETYQTLTEGTQ